MKEDFPAHSALFEQVRRTPYITVSTGNGCPRATPLYFSLCKIKGALCVVWRSSTLATHSKQIVHTPSASGVIFDSTQLPGTGIGLYLDGSVSVIKDIEDIREALSRLKERSDHAKDAIEDYTDKNSSQRLYAMEIRQAWMNGVIIEPDGRWHNTTCAIKLDELAPLYPLPPLASCRPAGT